MSSSTVQDRKAPSAGAKVSQGAPVVKETAGTVPSESLAAESYREGGAFSSNRGAEPENLSNLKSSSGASELSSAPNADARAAAHDTTSTNAASYDKATSSGAFKGENMPQSYAGTAPSYVADNYLRDPAGPHGKNLTEGGDWSEGRAQEGIRKALAAEPGSLNDPSRLAEQQFQQNNNSRAADSGPRQGELTNETRFDALNSETSS